MAHHPVFAAVYDRLMAAVEADWLGAARAELLGQARGDVLEVGGGTGANLAHYGSDVTSLTVCEPDRAMRRRLERRARRATAGVRPVIHAGGIPGLPFAAETFDTVVCTLVLCTVPDPAAGLAELRRLLRRGGRLLFIEHVLAPRWVGRVQHAIAPAWQHLAGGCHPDRDTIGAMQRAGFVIGTCERPAVMGRYSAGVVVIGHAVRREEAA
jgi:SAM-dependent methyltransferase